MKTAGRLVRKARARARDRSSLRTHNYDSYPENTNVIVGIVKEALFCKAGPALMGGLLLVTLFAQAGFAQTTPPLKFYNNYLVTGDYVAAGWADKQLDPTTPGYATGRIKIPDPLQPNAQQIPLGADIVAAFLYWQTVESTPGQGKDAFFRGYAITGDVLGDPTQPVAWSAGGCSGTAQGTKTIGSYRADVRAYLPVDPSGIVLANSAIGHEVKLRDRGTNGSTAPFTLGATLVIIHRVLSPDFALNAVILVDGSFAQSNAVAFMSQNVVGFYQAATTPIAPVGPVLKLTHIVGNGQLNKFQTVSLTTSHGTTSSTTSLPSLYGSGMPAFPGRYNGSWDNPTWVVDNSSFPGSVVADADSANTTVVPSSSNSGCTSWGAVVLGITVQDYPDKDGLLNVWESNQGYQDVRTGEWVDLIGPNPDSKDIFLQIDYMCSSVNKNGADITCTSPTSSKPSQAAVDKMTTAFSNQGVTVHYDLTASDHRVIEAAACTDDLSTNPPTLCPFPGQSGVVGWKAGFQFLKSQPLNYSTEDQCEANTNCVRRFPEKQKDSYHEVIFGQALGVPNWSLQDGSLTQVQISGNVATFTTSSPHGPLGDRVTIGDAISNPNLNGTFYVTDTGTNTFTISITAPNATYTQATDPSLSVGPGVASFGSGMSDIGGADSVITLDSWGADGQLVTVQAGTVTHEIGHSIALTHGGFWFDKLNGPDDYRPTIGDNCKTNYQTVMNYLFQVDLLGTTETVDLSRQELTSLNETGLSNGTALLETLTNAATFYPTTKWYSPVAPNAFATAAATHCDGSPKLSTDVSTQMYLVDGLTTGIQWPNTPNQDINYSGLLQGDISPTGPLANLRGYNDWANVDLRQIGATGSDVVDAGKLFATGGKFFGSGGRLFGTGGKFFGSGGRLFGTGGVIHGELTFGAANSYTRPPRNLTATPNKSLKAVVVTWNKPVFGQVDFYYVYRLLGAVSATNPLSNATQLAQVPGTTLRNDDNTAKNNTFYTYFAIAEVDTRKSGPSNLNAKLVKF